MSSTPAHARDAAFMDPGAMSAGRGSVGNDAVVVEPKGDINVGDSALNVSRRTTLFFVNQTNLPVELESVVANNDGAVTSTIVDDDCTKEGKIPASSRCSLAVEVVPSSVGSWSVEVLMTHKGAGRIARAKLIGKTTSKAGADGKETGLSLSSREVKPIDFGEVEIGSSKVVRSAVMVNDSDVVVTIKKIEVIAADNGLERLEDGCTVDMELKAGESCPVTLVWQPTAKGQISTELIIRHTGKLGFAVVPLRGVAKGDDTSSKPATTDKGGDDNKSAAKVTGGKLPPPSIADELASTGKITAVSADMLPRGVTGGAASPGSSTFRLIGTVGLKAILLKPDGTTGFFGLGEEIPYGDDKIAKIVSVTANQAEIVVNGKKQVLRSGVAPELQALAAAASESASKDDKGSSSKKGASSSHDGSGGR